MVSHAYPVYGGRHRIGQVFTKGNSGQGSGAALFQISAADLLQAWPGIIGHAGQKPELIGFSYNQHTSLMGAVGNSRRMGLGSGSGTGSPDSSLAAAQGSTPGAMPNKWRLEAEGVCSKVFMGIYILRKNSRQRENASSAKGESES